MWVHGIHGLHAERCAEHAEDRGRQVGQPFARPDAIGKMLTTTFRGAAVAKALCFTQELSLRLPPRVMWDRFRVEHVLANLLSSAIKFSMQGGPIKISVEPAAEVGSDNLVPVIYYACMHRKAILSTFPALFIFKTGVGATRILRSNGFSNLIIGNVLEDDVASFISAGADNIFHHKPLRMNSFVTLDTVREG